MLQGGGREFSAIAQQLREVNPGELIRIVAGYMDWDNVDWDLDFDWSAFTPLAYTEAGVHSDSSYTPGDLGPSNFWRPYDWHPLIPVPEPSIPILTMLGICAILLRRRNG